MNSLPYGSLSPTVTFYRWPNSTQVVSNVVTPCVDVATVKKELPVYDDLSNVAIERKVASAQKAVEDLVNRDTTKRERISLWMRPKRIISLPYGVHEILQVEQQIQSGGEFTNTDDYEVIGLDYLDLRLDYAYPTRVRYNSGNDTVEAIMQEAILQETAFYFKNRNDPNEEQPPIVNGVTAITMNLLANHVR